MLKKSLVLLAAVFLFAAGVEAQGPRRVAMGDWPEMRGPYRDGTSKERGLPDSWALDGENHLWRAPFGGRSAPIVMGNRVYVQNPAGRDAELQERVMALDADSGKVIWEHRFNTFQSDVPPHRIGWASPAADPETGNIYALGGSATVIALSRDGKLLWDRSIGEEFAAFTTHGGRTASPLIDGDLVIVSAAVSNWGAFGARQHRFIALDKRTGEIVYVSSPGVRPYDTNYSSGLIATLGGQRVLITGSGDGGVYAIKPQTGERVWGFMAAKRAINTGVAVSGNRVIVSHGDENLDTPQMGMIAAIDGSLTGDIKTTLWAVKGIEFGFSSPVIDGQRIYQIDNGGWLFAFDLNDGHELWRLQIGRSQRAPLVLADGKLYAGTENGRFLIIRPMADRAEILSDVELPISTASAGGSEGTPEQIVSNVAVSRGRIFFVSSDAVYAIGPRTAQSQSGFAVDEPAVTGSGPAVHVQVTPTEITLEPGDSATLKARLFDAQGRFIREAQAEWSLDGLRGTAASGLFTASTEPVDQAGLVRATVDGVTGAARVRVVRALPWTEDFESLPDGQLPVGWINVSAAKFGVAPLGGTRALHKTPDNTLFKRMRVFMGSAEFSNYTVQADVQTPTRRRQQGDIGITAQRYSLILYGTSQRVKIEPWEPETARTVTVPFPWKPDTWYTLKLEVQNQPDGAVRARGKVWPAGEPEPAAWTIEKLDPIGNREGMPGLFIDAEFGAHVDNYSVTPNP
ncbi:MAG: PQQ-binding-like beta-propeller repeat protein [Vicinamibacterales bacterium]